MPRGMATKYVLHPSDQVSATQLARLYGVRLGECVQAAFLLGFSAKRLSELIHLYPQADGNYTLPEGVHNGQSH
jgi:hypothetical protein